MSVLCVSLRDYHTFLTLPSRPPSPLSPLSLLALSSLLSPLPPSLLPPSSPPSRLSLSYLINRVPQLLKASTKAVCRTRLYKALQWYSGVEEKGCFYIQQFCNLTLDHAISRLVHVSQHVDVFAA